MDKRQIIRQKSVYRRKKRKEQILDEIQLKWILFMVKKNQILECKDVRPNVRVLLAKHGKTVEEFDKVWLRIS